MEEPPLQELTELKVNDLLLVGGKKLGFLNFLQWRIIHGSIATDGHACGTPEYSSRRAMSVLWGARRYRTFVLGCSGVQGLFICFRFCLVILMNTFLIICLGE